MRAVGFFITGDLGRVDADGFIHIVGRNKDLIISSGDTVDPREVESRIDALPGVREPAAMRVPHPDLGETVVAVVVPEPGACLTPEAVGDGIAADLARFKQPRHVALATALPRNTMGKVHKPARRKEYRTLFA